MGSWTSTGAVVRLLLAAGGLACAATGARATEPALETELERTLYALGLRCGYDLVGFALREPDLAFVERGLRDAALRRAPLVNERAYHPKINELLGQRRGLAIAVEKRASAAFLREVAGWEGAHPLPGGGYLFELRPGSAAGPRPGEAVRVHFHGRLRDGTVFDSSVERGKPVAVRLGRLVPCWREGLQRMRVGGRSRLVCPADTAYGDEGTRRVPGGAAIDSEIELLEVLP